MTDRQFRMSFFKQGRDSIVFINTVSNKTMLKQQRNCFVSTSTEYGTQRTVKQVLLNSSKGNNLMWECYPQAAILDCLLHT